MKCPPGEHACCLYVFSIYRCTTITYTAYPQQPPYQVHEMVHHIAHNVMVIQIQKH